jgi:pilus assembly protein Flp/PilA
MMWMIYHRAATVLRSARDREEGQGLVEYALILALVSIALVVALGLLADGIEGAFNDVINAL